MEKEFKHISVIQKGISLHIEANEEKKPSIEDYKLQTIDNDSRWVFKIHKEEYDYDLSKWQSNNSYFPFSTMEDMNKTRLYISDIKRQQTELNKWDASDCIKIKKSLAHFKKPKVLGIDYEFSINDKGMITEIDIEAKESQDELYDKFIHGFINYPSNLRKKSLLDEFTITRKQY